MPSPGATSFLIGLSRLFGWIYTIAWSASFYPQPLLNIRRHTTAGSSPSFPFLNIIGFAAYLISSSSLFYSPVIRAQYAARNGGKTPTVRGNDLAFAAHAMVMSLVVASMFFVGRKCWGMRGKRGKVEWWVKGVAAGVLVGIAGVGMIVRGWGNGNPMGWAAIDIVYAFGYGKLVITTVKYTPQVISNYKQQSTVGWSIGQILLDLTGGVLSIAQLVIDSSLQGDWSGILGNPVKLGLGNVSILFDIVFMVQHYWLYRGREMEKDAEGLGEDVEGRPLLLDNDNERHRD